MDLYAKITGLSSKTISDKTEEKINKKKYSDKNIEKLIKKIELN